MENKRKTFNARAALLLPVSLAIPLALAGCGKGAAGNASVAATEATPAGDPATLDPGRWELTATTENDVARPFGSAPSTAPEAANSPYGRPQTSTKTICVTPDLATRPSPVLILATDSVGRCERRIWTLHDGRIDGDLTCAPDGTMPNGLTIAMNVTGSYARDRFDAEANAQAGVLSFRQKVVAKRVGECTGDEGP